MGGWCKLQLAMHFMSHIQLNIFCKLFSLSYFGICYCIVTYKTGETVANHLNNYRIYIVFHDKRGIGGGLPDPYIDKHYWNVYRIRYVEILSGCRFSLCPTNFNAEFSRKCSQKVLNWVHIYIYIYIHVCIYTSTSSGINIYPSSSKQAWSMWVNTTSK